MTNRNRPSRRAKEVEIDGRAQLNEHVQHLKDNLHGVSDAARQMAREQVGSLRNAATSYFEQGRSKARSVEQSLEDHIRERPLRSVLIALAAGAVLGVLWSRR